MEIFFVIFIASFPIFFTSVNIYNLFSKKKFIQNVTDTMIFTLGPILTLFVYESFWNPLSWQESFTNNWLILPFHEPVSNHLSILVIALIAVFGYALLRIKKTSLPPLVIVLCMSAMYIGCALSIVWILQLLPHIAEANVLFPFEGFLMCLFPLNFIISTIALSRRIIQESAESSSKKEYELQFMKWCSKVLENSRNYPNAAFILMWPLLCLIVIVLTLFGQKPDSLITAFTDTSDWLFSQKVSPPVDPFGCEYLCTAASGGHKRVVKPLRIGERLGRPIIVNRQLCVANAFEELIQKKTPRFHKLLRSIYDVVGYAIAKRIKTPLAADIAYIVIKPLEWFLLLILYLVEIKPEDKIAKQYLPNGSAPE